MHSYIHTYKDSSESLRSRGWSRRLILFYRFLNNLTPNHKRDPIPLFAPISHSFRDPPVLKHITSRTESFKSSFYPDSLSEWNKLDPAKRESSSVNVCEKKLFSIMRPPAKFVYGVHYPKGFTYLTQLVVRLGKHNSHKFKHNFIDTINPICPANSFIEQTQSPRWCQRCSCSLQTF